MQKMSEMDLRSELEESPLPFLHNLVDKKQGDFMGGGMLTKNRGGGMSEAVLIWARSRTMRACMHAFASHLPHIFFPHVGEHVRPISV